MVTCPGRAILLRSPQSRSGQARAAGGGRGRTEEAPHGRRGSALARWPGRPGVWIAPAAARRRRRRTCPGGCCHRSAPTGSELAALGPLRRLQTASSLFPFLFYRRRRAGISTQGLSSHVTPGPAPRAAGRRPPGGAGGAREAREAQEANGAPPRPAPPRPAPSSSAPPRPPREKLLSPAPGCPRVSHLGISEAGPTSRPCGNRGDGNWK